jgi:farnesyl diphosphate synthase
MVQFKTAIYSFYLPFACAALLLNCKDSLVEARSIALQLGILFQVQDDVLDVFGDPEMTGKIGTDIEEGKCTWLLCRLLQKTALTPADRQTLQRCYGSRQGVHSIEEIYRRYGLQADFEQVEQAMVVDIEHRIRQLPNLWSQRVFTNFLSKIVKRIK